jgi:hypothetical protein
MNCHWIGARQAQGLALLSTWNIQIVSSWDSIFGSLSGERALFNEGHGRLVTAAVITVLSIGFGSQLEDEVMYWRRDETWSV